MASPVTPTYFKCVVRSADSAEKESHMFQRKTSSTKYGLAFLAGGIVGAAIALWFAPMTGRKLQRQIRSKWAEGKDNFEGLAENIEHVVAGVQDAARTVQAKAREFAK